MSEEENNNNNKIEMQELAGYYTYRSFLNDPLPENDFNKIKFAEAELFLIPESNGALTGTLSFPADEGALEKQFMDITGSIKILPSSSPTIEFTSKGRPNTKIFDYLYNHSCSIARIWEKGIDQRLALTGSVLRAQDQGSGDHIAKAGATASFIAVKREFTEPRDIKAVAIIPSALSMVASKSHRLKHMTWHALRGVWNDLDETSKMKIQDLGWGLERPPFNKDGMLVLDNGAGEDFLFMHRMMITMIRDDYASKGVPYIESWKTLPSPNTAQFSYSEQDDPEHTGKKIYRFNSSDSGFMVPPAQPTDDDSLKFLKSPEFFRYVMSQLERQFKRESYLSALSLGALGNLLEFTIHNQMHMRWSSVSRDPKSGKPAIRDDFDFDPKWDDPKYDYLGEFYSSHVNPVFWRLHGWIDDRIEDWFSAHEAAHPGDVERYEYRGVSWFKPGKWVQVSKPFYWPEQHGMHHHASNDDDQKETDTMLKVLEIIKAALARTPALRRISLRHKRFGLSSFMRAIELDKVELDGAIE
jgi:hypothetical protein